MSYGIAVLVFCTGLFTAVCTVSYILWGYCHFKNKDPFEGE